MGVDYIARSLKDVPPRIRHLGCRVAAVAAVGSILYLNSRAVVEIDQWTARIKSRGAISSPYGVPSTSERDGDRSIPV